MGALGKNEILEVIHWHERNLRENFGVASLQLFGSVARETATPDSDLDMLVAFSSGPTFDQYFDLKFFLEEIVGRNVDLVTEDGLHPRLRRMIEAELVRAA